MEGEHLLDSKGSVQVAINNTDYLTVRGESGYSNTDIIIKCSTDTRGLVFNNGSNINIYGITITGCGQKGVIPLLFINIASLFIYHTTLYNTTGGGLHVLHSDTGTHNIVITNSAFTNNTIVGGGGLYIHSYTSTCNITITNSVFTNNTIGGNGGGLYIYSYAGTHNIAVTNSAYTNNTIGGEGGGLYVLSYTGTHNIITITNSVFMCNTIGTGEAGGGLFIAGTHNIVITNSVFANNTIISDKGGGLYIYSDNGTHDITIINSAFTNNTIIGGIGAGLLIFSNIDDSTFTCNNNAIASGGGGGLFVITGHGTCIHNITITNSVFTNNTITIDGGGGLFISTGTGTHNITITNSVFTNNTIGNNGGGLIFATEHSNNITIINNAFTNNTAGFGGGLFINFKTDTHNNITITNSAFTNNTFGYGGGGLCIETGSSINNNITIANSTFANNNNGSGIQVLNRVTLIFTEGHSIVANNSSPTDGGGIFLAGNSYLTTSKGGHVSFINNTVHRYGGAIYSTDNDYTSLRYEVLLTDLKYYYDQCSVYDLSATFINNSAARAGDHLYGGILTFCNSVHYMNNTHLHYLLQCNNIPDTLKHATSVHPLSPVSSDPIAVCPCVNGTVDCNIVSLHREVYPGQILNVSLVTVGLCGGVSPGTIVVEHDKQIKLMSGTTTDYTCTSCTTLNYTVKLTTDISNTTITVNIPDGDIHNIRPIIVNLTILPCPLGLVVDFTSGDCVCNNGITHISGVICNISWMPYPIQRSGNNWIYHRFDYYNCTIAHIGCPFDYCRKSQVKFSLNDSDLQCNYNRSGILCGQCQPGLSLMIGSNRCANCTDTILVPVSIIIIAAVAGVILVIVLVLLNLTVSVGSVNGILFYANLVKLNESVFFPNGNIPAITQFISWCNLDLGFEYCFIDGLDGYIKTWLQFVFPLYVWFLVVVIIVGCRYSGRLSRLCGRNAVPVLATLILMSYTKLSRTVTNALMTNTLQCGEHKWSVWNVDGNIDYLGGKHIALFTVSLLFLITGLVYTGLVFSSQWLQRHSGKCCKSTRDPVVRLKPLIDAYTGPFKDKYRFWTGLCLIVRLILTVAFSFTTTLQSKLNNYIIVVTIVAMSIIFVGTRAYKDKRLTVLETFSFINLMCLSFMTILSTDLDENYAASTNVIVSVSVSIEMLLFVIIVAVHCYFAFKKVLPNCKLCCKTHIPSEEEAPLIASAGDTEEQGSPAHVITRREELIFDVYVNKEHP